MYRCRAHVQWDFFDVQNFSFYKFPICNLNSFYYYGLEAKRCNLYKTLEYMSIMAAEQEPVLKQPFCAIPTAQQCSRAPDPKRGIICFLYNFICKEHRERKHVCLFRSWVSYTFFNKRKMFYQIGDLGTQAHQVEG